jgi:hypothetical protein
MDSLIERIARHADIDTRCAMGFGDIDKRVALGFPPRKLPPSDLKIQAGRTMTYPGYPITVIDFEKGWWIRLVATEYGIIKWSFDLRRYEHVRPVTI